MTFTCVRQTFSYKVLPFGLCNAQTTFQISIFAKFVHDSMYIYMDDFTPYGKIFQKAVDNLENVLKKCIEMS